MRAIVIPAYNEEATLDQILCSVIQFCNIIIVVDDCSTDSTSEICTRYNYVHLLSNSVNRGYDYSILKGFYYACNLKASSILSLDADGQHPISEIPKLFDDIENQEYAVVIGSRSKLPRISEYIFSFYTYAFFGVWDITSGFKCYKSTIFSDYSFPDYPSVGTYFTIKCLLDGYIVKSSSIRIQERVGSISRFGLNTSAEKKILLAFIHAVILHLRKFLSVLHLP